MFEAKPPHPAQADDVSAALAAESPLRALSWSELVARLAASRELRSALIQHEASSTASFDAHCARHLSARHSQPRPHDQESVNLDDLANRKCTGGKTSAGDTERRPATRGNE